MIKRVLLSIALMLIAVPPAAAERLITSLSSHQVLVTSSFTDIELTLFGSIERDAKTVSRKGEYDIICTAPHMGRLAEKRDGYRPLAQTGYPIVVVALTNNNSPIKSLESARPYAGCRRKEVDDLPDHESGACKQWAGAGQECKLH